MITYFVAKYEKCRKYVFLGGCPQIITILHREGHRNLVQCYMNLYYVIYGRPLMLVMLMVMSMVNSGRHQVERQRRMGGCRRWLEPRAKQLQQPRSEG